MKTDTETIVAAMRVLARDIQSEDGVANSAIAEAADRLQQLQDALMFLHLATIPNTDAAAMFLTEARKKAAKALGLP